ncbi:MAG: tyrosine-type recombinase/integrase [Candidatus Muiribacteriota bacterium]
MKKARTVCFSTLVKSKTAFINSLNINSNSKYTYTRNLKQFFIFLNEHKKEEINRNLIVIYIEYLRNLELSDFTISNYLNCLKQFFRWCADNNICKNICRNIKFKNNIKGFRKKTLQLEDVAKLMKILPQNSVKEKRDFAIINLMLRTGLRAVEINRTLYSDIQKIDNNQVLYVHGKGRSSKDEFVLLTQNTLRPLLNYIIAYEKKFNSLKSTDPLFPSFSNKNLLKPLSTRSISRIVKTAFIKAGLDSDKYSAHSLRHTAVTMCLLGGATIQEARILARHTNINTTLIYAQNINRLSEAPENYIDKFLSDLK